MATFEVQVEGLTQISITDESAPTQDELTQFLNDGIKDLTNKVTTIDNTNLNPQGETQQEVVNQAYNNIQNRINEMNKFYNSFLA